MSILFPSSPPDHKLYDTTILDDESKWTINNAHDPGILKTDQGYYIYSTDVRMGGELTPGVMVRRSQDLIHWEWVGYALPGIPEIAAEWSQAINLWAPDVVKVGDKYRMYYSASTFGSTRSMIGLMESDSPEGPWVDCGSVVRTQEGDGPNAIDPHVVNDTEGQQWMVYGSFFGGIHILPLDQQTGKPTVEGFGTLLAIRDKATVDGAIEGPYIVYHPEFRKYYLFVSYDSLFSDYNVRVARADHITGPYTDIHGHVLTDTDYRPQHEIGNKIVGGYRFQEGEGWVAPGHNSVLNDDGDFYIVHHARGEKDKHWSYLHIRKILWTADGWPVVSPERYAGEQEQDLEASQIPGQWETILLNPGENGQIPSQPLELREDGSLQHHGQPGSWQLQDARTLVLEWLSTSGESQRSVVKLLPSWDWERHCPTIVFTGMTERGWSIWGKQIASITV
ncbi:arabinan endo-1,5-alpha-L-arabinosidase [Paenibacillus wulumuqiensis]|uniref:arabinan endo-1,5-alpha-L-arabinosidase n=1 Tax=Paenibacillus wulumuqiensis TaxID=1567107 RepID=UPI000619443A|nr:arabinan endo-1,5-alpha-L-arabinosidase [Paenibacillus wulumuqiensis]